MPTVLMVVIGLGLLNVWLLRAGSATSFRGGDARSLRQEFATYGLPPWFFYVVGALKVGAAIGLLAGIWVPALVLPSSALVAALMIGAVAMHLKVRDPFLKWLPASAMLVMSSGLCVIA